MILASIQPILAIQPHGGSDNLDIATVKGYKAIVRRDSWQPGQLCVFIEPDSVLPDAPWAAFYKAKSSRVKAVKLRGSWSFGIIESAATVGYTGLMEPGLDVTAALGITKYEAPAPQDLAASGPYGFGIPKTDEHRVEALDPASMPPWGTLVDVTLKIDGQSWSAFCRRDEYGDCETGIGGRSFLYKLDSENHYTRNARAYHVLDKLKTFCVSHSVNLCIRAEQYGAGVQADPNNPHCKLPLSLAFYSTWLMDERRYAHKGEPFYIHAIAPQMGLPVVPILEQDVPLTPELLSKYSEGIDALPDGSPFEGVVIQWAGGSFKVINRTYDSKKK